MYEVIKISNKIDADMPVFTILAASKITGLHSQTLRQYDRIGLVSPHRVSYSERRYSYNDINKIKYIHYLSDVKKINLAGIKEILRLEEENRILKNTLDRERRENFFAAQRHGEVDVIYFE